METKQDEELEARLALVVSRAHRSLSGDERALVRKRIERDLEQREEMRTLPLTNGDAPDTGFNPRISREGSVAW